MRKKKEEKVQAKVAKAAGKNVSAPKLSEYSKQLVDKFKESVLKDKAFSIAIEALDTQDLNAITREAGNVLSRWLQLVEHRRRTTKHYTHLNEAPLGVQHYHTLMLHEVVQQTLACLDTLRGLLVRLELTGLNAHLSKFFIDHMLVPGGKPGPHTLNTKFIHEDREVLYEMLTAQGLSETETVILDEILDIIPEEAKVKVVQPWSPEQPWPGGPAGAGVGIPNINISFPKGFDNWFEGAFQNLRDSFPTTVDHEWAFGMAGAYGEPVITTDFSRLARRVNPAWYIWVAVGMIIIGGICKEAGWVDLGSALGMAGTIVIAAGGIGGAGGGGNIIVDP